QHLTPLVQARMTYIKRRWKKANLARKSAMHV
ncbi:hypothetical protein AVDCRST_MAG94-6970, partial [uncultured Leptolyngbya sp.]